MKGKMPLLILVGVAVVLSLSLGLMSTLLRKTSEDLQKSREQHNALKDDYADLFAGAAKRGYITFTLNPPLVSDWVETEEEAHIRLSKINRGDKDVKYHGETK